MPSKLTPWVLLSTLALLLPLCAGEPESLEDFEPPPEGFEERRYPLETLTSNRANLEDSGRVVGLDIASSLSSLSSESLIALLKHAVAPDSWTRRGPARIGTEGANLVVLQKKDVHDEIAKVLQWLREGYSTPAKTSVALVSLKPEALAKLLAGNGALPVAEFAKLAEDAGESATLLCDLRGFEGQQISSTSTFRQHYLGDLDVSGAVLDPVIRSAIQGLTARAKAVRTPDGNTVRVDLRLSWTGPAVMENALLRMRGTSIQESFVLSRPKTDEEKKSNPEKKDEPVQERQPGATSGADFRSEINIESKRQAAAELITTLIVSRGHYLLAGVIDLSLLGDGKTPDRRAVFVRSEIGAPGVPAIQAGLGGLKDGEIFKLYPLGASEPIPSFPPPYWYGEPSYSTSVELGASAGHPNQGVANPFSMAPIAAATLNVQKFQSQFTERVRKNKLIESFGNVLFTRLTADDHARLSANLTSPVRQMLSGVRVRAVAVALTQTEYRKLLINEPAKIDDAALAALQNSPSATTLADSCLMVQPMQRNYIFGGNLINAITDMEISGDTYDPTPQTIMDRGYVLGAEYFRQQGEGLADVTVQMRIFPGTKLEKVPFDSYALASGSEATLALGMNTELTRARMAVLSLHGAMNGAKGQFNIVTSVPMTPGTDGKPDSRQVVLFVRADDTTQP